MEIFLVYSVTDTEGQYYALVQEANGKPNPPVLVPVKVNRNEIDFTISDERSFHGKITKKTLVGKFEGSNETITLKRKKSYWQ